MRNLGSSNDSGLSTDEIEDEEMARMAIATFQAREEEIERKKMEVKERVELQLGRAEEESRRLAQIWEVSWSKSLINVESLSNSLSYQIGYQSQTLVYLSPKGSLVLQQ